VIETLSSDSGVVQMIDELDQKIIGELQRDGRQSFVELAKKLNVVEGTVRKRYKNLMEKGIIKVRACPDLQKLGFSFIGFMGLQVQMADLRAVMNELSQKPNVCHLAFVTGRWDLMAVVAARSPKELADFVENEISKLPSVLRTETLVNLDTIKGGQQGFDTEQLIKTLGAGRKEKRKREV